jgi:UPF0716 protein FxsA
MPLIFVGILLALPTLDIYATLRLAQALDVPGLLMFIPGIVAGILLMRRETSSLRSRFTGAVQTMGFQSFVFDSGRRMIAGALLLIPGVISDLVAIFLLSMPNRSLQPISAGSQGETRRPKTTSPAAEQTGAGATVDGEYRRVE